MAKDPGRMSWERAAKDEVADRLESDRNSFQSLIATQEALLKEGKSAYGSNVRAQGRTLALEILEGATTMLYGNVGKVDERNPDYIAFRADLNNTAAFLRESCDWDWKHALLHQGVLVPLNVLGN
jgi:hypothetical protein